MNPIQLGAEQLDSRKSYGDLLRGLASGVTPPPTFRGEAARLIPLDHAPLTIGTDLSCDIVLQGDLIAPRHATIEAWPEGFAIHDGPSRTGTFVNGRSVVWAGLKPGDLVQLGPYLFHVKKNVLLWLRQPAALTLAAMGLRLAFGNHVLLDDFNLVARPGEFVGLLGPSGAGKTTLLNALCGLAPIERGQILLNGEAFLEHPERFRHLIGYVPQEDIVHPELTPRQAFLFAARLRMPARSTSEERISMVEKTLALLELTERAELPIHKLSGGQRKRVSVGVELLGRPRLLFLDEPTSGLDPSTEAKLMATLRALAHQGRTILCTTHIMENVELFDRIAVLAPGGKLAYFGPPEEAQEYFEVERFSHIYDRLEAQTPEQWQTQFQESPHAWHLKQTIAGERQPRPFHHQDRSEATDRLSGISQWALLSHRFLKTLLADGKTRFLLIAQPLIIGGLVSMVFKDVRSLNFLLVIATLWFGCGLAAQQVVKERSILNRERRVHLDWLPYILSKFVLMTLLTFAQATAMWAIMGNLRSLPGDLTWQLTALLLAAANGVAFGLVISALASTTDSAAASVPLTLIPQIVLAGFLLPLPDMNRPTRMITDTMPARWSYTLMDIAWLQDRRIDTDLMKDATAVWGLGNLYLDYDFKDAKSRKQFLDDHKDRTVDRSGGARLAILVLIGLCALQIGGLSIGGWWARKG